MGIFFSTALILLASSAIIDDKDFFSLGTLLLVAGKYPIHNQREELTEDTRRRPIGKQLFYCEGSRAVHVQDLTATEKTPMWMVCPCS
jgi:hypothetical protein